MTKLFRAACAAILLAGPAFAGDIAISEAYVRAVAPGAGASAAYMTIRNDGAADTLVAARTDIARRVELHTHILEDGVARMREVEGGIAAPAGETVTLAPGGLHVMLMGLNGPLAAGATLPLTLVFENAGEMAIMAPIVDVQPGAMPMHGAPKS
jgi:copper(I)-binding protein